MVHTITYEVFCVCFHNLYDSENDDDESCVSLLCRLSGFFVCVLPFTCVADILTYPSRIAFERMVEIR